MAIFSGGAGIDVAHHVNSKGGGNSVLQGACAWGTYRHCIQVGRGHTGHRVNIVTASGSSGINSNGLARSEPEQPGDDKADKPVGMKPRFTRFRAPEAQLGKDDIKDNNLVRSISKQLDDIEMNDNDLVRRVPRGMAKQSKPKPSVNGSVWRNDNKSVSRSKLKQPSKAKPRRKQSKPSKPRSTPKEPSASDGDIGINGEWDSLGIVSLESSEIINVSVQSDTSYDDIGNNGEWDPLGILISTEINVSVKSKTKQPGGDEINDTVSERISEPKECSEDEINKNDSALDTIFNQPTDQELERNDSVNASSSATPRSTEEEVFDEEEFLKYHWPGYKRPKAEAASEDTSKFSQESRPSTLKESQSSPTPDHENVVDTPITSKILEELAKPPFKELWEMTREERLASDAGFRSQGRVLWENLTPAIPDATESDTCLPNVKKSELESDPPVR